MQSYTYYKDALQDVAKPCLFLDTDLFYKNIQAIMNASKDKKFVLLANLFVVFLY